MTSAAEPCVSTPTPLVAPDAGSDHRHARIGWAAIGLHHCGDEHPTSYTPIRGAFGPLPGDYQSVEAGELYAVVAAIRYTQPAQNLHLIVDAGYVVNGF